MTHAIDRRNLLKLGCALPGLFVAGNALAQSQASTVSGLIFCHTMGTAADLALFKKATGVDFNLTCQVNSTDSISKMATGAGRTYEVFNLNRQFVGTAIKQGLVAPLDLTKISNYKFIDPKFTQSGYSVANGKTYSVPFQFGFDSVVYNRKKIGHVDSYGVLFDEKYRGQVSMKDDPLPSIAQAALFLGHKDPFKMSDGELAEVTKFLISKKPMFRKLWGGFAEAVSLLKSEEVVAVGDGWISMAWTLNDKGTGSDFAQANPKEKSLIWTVDWLIPKDAAGRPGAEAAYSFMNWSIGAEQAANMGRNVGYVSPSSAGIPLLNAEEKRAIGYDNYQNVLDNGVWQETLPQNYQSWVDSWSRFKAA